MRISLVSGLGVGFVLAVATACGGSSATQAPPAQASQAGGAPTCASVVGTGGQVGIAGLAFNPATTTASAGGTVTWTNADSVAHTVTFDNGPDCGQLAAGKSVTVTFPAAGTYAYHCTIHSQMKGTVTVS